MATCTHTYTHAHTCIHTYTLICTLANKQNETRIRNTCVYTQSTRQRGRTGYKHSHVYACIHLRWRVDHRNWSEVPIAGSKCNADDNGRHVAVKDRRVECARDDAERKEREEGESENNKDKDWSPVLRLCRECERESKLKLRKSSLTTVSTCPWPHTCTSWEMKNNFLYVNCHKKGALFTDNIPNIWETSLYNTLAWFKSITACCNVV